MKSRSCPVVGKSPLADDVLLSVSEAFYALTGNRPSPNQVWRWTKRGVAGVRLETVWFGGNQKVSLAQARLFLAKSTDAQRNRKRNTDNSIGAVVCSKAEKILDQEGV